MPEIWVGTAVTPNGDGQRSRHELRQVLRGERRQQLGIDDLRRDHGA